MTFHRWVEKDTLVKSTDVLIDVLQFARSAAMTSQQTIEVCPLGAHDQCGDDWDQGLLVRDVATQKVLRVEQDVPPEGYFMLWKPALDALPLVRFRSDGFVASGLEGSFYLCAKNTPAASSRIVLLRTGRIRAVTGEFPVCHTD